MLTNLLFGPRWRPVPHRASQDAWYIRARVLDEKAIAAAINALSEGKPEESRAFIDNVRRVPGQRASVSHRLTLEELADTDRALLEQVDLNGFGAVLTLGTAQPAAMFFGNDESRERAQNAYNALRRASRLRWDWRRARRLGFVVLIWALTIVAGARLFISPEPFLIAISLAAVALSVISAIRISPLSPLPSLPHQLKFKRHARRR